VTRRTIDAAETRIAALLTVGHGTLGAESLVELLREAGVESLVDIRTAPGSRRFPHFMRGEMERWVPEAGIHYRWERDLGGFRKAAPDSPNSMLRNASFRGYADYMLSGTFWAALDAVLDELQDRAVAVMCSESVWWRCHRRLVADATVLARGLQVEHLMHDGRLGQHRITEGARLVGRNRVMYDAGEETLFAPGAT
jgi:uncharacterized protein (DUF488 family)